MAMWKYMTDTSDGENTLAPGMRMRTCITCGKEFPDRIKATTDNRKWCSLECIDEFYEDYGRRD